VQKLIEDGDIQNSRLIAATELHISIWGTLSYVII